jgi:hypothetical protein
MGDSSVENLIALEKDPMIQIFRFLNKTVFSTWVLKMIQQSHLDFQIILSKYHTYTEKS